MYIYYRPYYHDYIDNIHLLYYNIHVYHTFYIIIIYHNNYNIVTYIMYTVIGCARQISLHMVRIKSGLNSDTITWRK